MPPCRVRHREIFRELLKLSTAAPGERRLAVWISVVATISFVTLEHFAVAAEAPFWSLIVLAAGPGAHLALPLWRSRFPVIVAAFYRLAVVIMALLLSRGLFDPVPIGEVSPWFWLLVVLEIGLLVSTLRLLQLRLPARRMDW